MTDPFLLGDFRKYLIASLNYAENTAIKYVGNVKNLMADLKIESTKSINPEKINALWLTEFWDHVKTKKGLKAQTVIGYQSALKKYLFFLEEADIMPAGTSEKIKLAKPEEVSIYGLSGEEKKALREYLVFNLKTGRQLRDAALILFLWGTGCRIGEALNLVIHENSIIYTDDPLKVSGDFRIYEGDIYVHIEHAKHHRDRNISVPAESIAYLNLYLDYREKKSKSLFINHSRNHENKRLTVGGAVKAIKRVFEAAGVKRPPDSISHALRHTAIETWILSGRTEQEIVSMAGFRDSQSLNPYFKRSRQLVKPFAHASNALNIKDINKKISSFEKMIKERYSIR